MLRNVCDYFHNVAQILLAVIVADVQISEKGENSRNLRSMKGFGIFLPVGKERGRGELSASVIVISSTCYICPVSRFVPSWPGNACLLFSKRQCSTDRRTFGFRNHVSRQWFLSGHVKHARDQDHGDVEQDPGHAVLVGISRNPCSNDWNNSIHPVMDRLNRTIPMPSH